MAQDSIINFKEVPLEAWRISLAGNLVQGVYDKSEILNSLKEFNDEKEMDTQLCLLTARLLNYNINLNTAITNYTFELIRSDSVIFTSKNNIGCNLINSIFEKLLQCKSKDKLCFSRIHFIAGLHEYRLGELTLTIR